MEYFEITFFVEGCSLQELALIEDKFRTNLQLPKWKNQVKDHSERLLSNKDVIFERFSDENKSYTEFRISIAEVYFTRKNFDQQMNDITQLVHHCFQLSPFLCFAVGIYEMTYYWTNYCKTLSDVKKKVMEHFPFLFFRKCAKNDQCLEEKNGIIFIYQEYLQDIFANPIQAMIVDENITEDEAIKKWESAKKKRGMDQ